MPSNPSAAVLAKRKAMWADPANPWHGTSNGYGNLHCRCTRCRAANAVKVLKLRAAPRAPLPPDSRHHGTAYGRFYWHCQCEVCVPTQRGGTTAPRPAAVPIPDYLISLPDLATQLGISRQRIHRIMAADRLIPFREIRGRLYFLRAEALLIPPARDTTRADQELREWKVQQREKDRLRRKRERKARERKELAEMVSRAAAWERQQEREQREQRRVADEVTQALHRQLTAEQRKVADEQRQAKVVRQQVVAQVKIPRVSGRRQQVIPPLPEPPVRRPRPKTAVPAGLLSTDEVAARLGIQYSSIRPIKLRYNLPDILHNGRYYFREADIDRVAAIRAQGTNKVAITPHGG